MSPRDCFESSDTLLLREGKPGATTGRTRCGRSSNPAGAVLVWLLLVLPLVVACSFGTGESAPPDTATPSPPATNTPTPLPVEATPVLTEEPTPETSPEAGLTERAVEQLVWLAVRDCADRLSGMMATQIAVRFDSSFDPVAGVWHIEAFSRDPSISFGRWELPDATGEVTDADDVAADIRDPNLSCHPPVSILAADNTPPHFRMPTPTPTPGPTSVLSPPTPTPPPFVIGATPEPTAQAHATPVPTPTPSPLTQEQAALRVWMATYQCFTPRLAASVFQAREIGPRHALIEGRAGSPDDPRLYGMWLVDTLTGLISPWDREAEVTMTQFCFKRP